MKRTALLLLIPLSLVAGCRRGVPEDAELAAPVGPQRIIALAPSVAEVVHVLGLSDRVVGVGDYVTWPPELAAKKRLGGLFNADFESIVALRPDLAILLESEESLRSRLEDVGVEVLTVPSDSLSDIEFAVGAIADRCGVKERGEEVLRQWRLDLAPRPLPVPLRVAMVVGREPRRLGDMVVAGPSTFFDQLLRRLGASNAFGDVGALYPQVGIEEILRRRPDVVVEIQPLTVPQSRVAALEKDWAGLADLAGGGPCIAIVDGPYVLVPGPRLPQVYAELRAALEACAGPQPGAP
jgi:iron complex transport system substrate-binding protein